MLGRIGEGGMGTVYKVEHVLSQRVEAMKVVHSDLLGSAGAEDRFCAKCECRPA